MQEIALEPEIIELVGKAAFPVVEALDRPTAPENVVRAARPPLDELVARADLPRELHAAARSALLAARSVGAGHRGEYGGFLRATHELLLRAGLPAPCELGVDAR